PDQARGARRRRDPRGPPPARALAPAKAPARRPQAPRRSPAQLRRRGHRRLAARSRAPLQAARDRRRAQARPPRRARGQGDDADPRRSAPPDRRAHRGARSPARRAAAPAQPRSASRRRAPPARRRSPLLAQAPRRAARRALDRTRQAPPHLRGPGSSHRPRRPRLPVARQLMSTSDPELRAHKEWLGLLQPIGLVVTPHALVRKQAVPDRDQAVRMQARLRELIVQVESGKPGKPHRSRELLDPEQAPPARLRDFPSFVVELLDWRPSDLIGGPDADPLPDELEVRLADLDDLLRPSYGVRSPDDPQKWLLLVQELEPGTP